MYAVKPEQLLQQYFGYAQFRSGQRQAIDAILQGRDVLAVMPTGAGKSVCYQISALLLPGLTVVVSPLISLMKDQVEALLQVGISAAYVNSSISSEAFFETMQNAGNGHYKILYVAPERLMTQSFLHLAERTKISMIAVDEAHCVSQWGQDFRQSYLDIPRLIDRLPTRPICTAFTATATVQVEQDIIAMLRLCDPVCVKTGFDRKNLFFGVRRPSRKKTELLQILQENKDKSGIVYCTTRKTVEDVCEFLQEHGYGATRYHAGLSDRERAENQEDFLYDRKPIMVATNAFGMGIDKSNVSFVVHYNMPKDLESYYQEAGRAGRDGEPAQCILLYHSKDVRMNEFLLERSRETMEIEDESLRQFLQEKSKERLKQMTFYATSTDCLRRRLLGYFGEKAPETCGNCSCCLDNTVEEDATLAAKKIVSCVYRGQQKKYHLSKSMTANVLAGSKRQTLLDMGLDELSTYGLMQDWSRREITALIEELVLRGDLGMRPFKDYQELVITEGSAEIIRNQKKFIWRKPAPPKQKALSTKTIANDPTMSEADNALFQKLRELRTKLAKNEGVPPYFIFTDASLRDMCRKKPERMKELREVSGVGVIKAQRYGKQFLQVIAAHLRTE